MCAIVVVSCAPAQPSAPSASAESPFVSVPFSALPGWSEDTHAEGLTAFRRSCSTLESMPADRPVGPSGIAGRVSDWRIVCAAARNSDDRSAKAFFEQWFRVYAVGAGGQKNGLFTGYYEPELRGSLTRSAAYPVPLYRRPPDLVTAEPNATGGNHGGPRQSGRAVQGRIEPYHDRAAIEAGALAGQKLELVWVQDAIEAYFLQVQGSGRVRLDDGRIVRVGYAGDNGLAYVSIGRVLVERGTFRVSEVTMETLKSWLRAHPEEAASLMKQNPRYVFFRTLEGDGPIGAGGAPLTPGRSLAIDPAFLPLGAPLWLDTNWPGEPGRPLRRLVIAQDTGAAIKGNVRGDVFWGAGADAERRAGMMRETGRFYLLLPETVARRLPPAS